MKILIILISCVLKEINCLENIADVFPLNLMYGAGKPKFNVWGCKGLQRKLGLVD